jgi:hypothetical protein
VLLSKRAPLSRRALPDLHARPRECLPFERGHFPYLWGSRLPGIHRGLARINHSCVRGNVVGRPTGEPSRNNGVETLSRRRQNVSRVYRELPVSLSIGGDRPGTRLVFDKKCDDLARQKKQHQMTLDNRIESAIANIVSHGEGESIEFWYVNAVSPCSGSNSDHEREALYKAAKSTASDAVSQCVSCYVATGHAKARPGVTRSNGKFRRSLEG